MVPSCASTSCLTRLKPRPVPPYLRVVLMSTCTAARGAPQRAASGVRACMHACFKACTQQQPCLWHSSVHSRTPPAQTAGRSGRTCPRECQCPCPASMGGHVWTCGRLEAVWWVCVTGKAMYVAKEQPWTKAWCRVRRRPTAIMARQAVCEPTSCPTMAWLCHQSCGPAAMCAHLHVHLHHAALQRGTDADRARVRELA